MRQIADAPGLAAEIVVLAEPTALTVVTFVQFRSCYGRAVFGVLKNLHRAIVAGLVARATNRASSEHP